MLMLGLFERVEEAKEKIELRNIDILKLILAYIVVLRHCAQFFYKYGTIPEIILTNIISPIAVPTFFLISGYLISISGWTKEKVIKQTIRILKLYLVWSVIYIPVGFNKGESLYNCIRKIVFDGFYYHLWYLPSMAFAIFFVYLIKKIGNVKIQWGIVWILFIIAVFTETYKVLGIESSYILTQYKRVFFTTRNGLFFGTIYVYMGSFFREKNIIINRKINRHILWGIILILLIIEGIVTNYVFHINVVNVSVAAIIISPILFYLFITTKNIVTSKRGKLIRQQSTIIYCIHPWILMISRIFCRPLIAIVLTIFISTIFAVTISKTKSLNNFLA